MFHKALKEMFRREAMKKACGGMVKKYADGGEISAIDHDNDPVDVGSGNPVPQEQISSEDITKAATKAKMAPNGKFFSTAATPNSFIQNMTGGYAEGGEVSPVEEAIKRKGKKPGVAAFIKGKTY